MISSFDAVVVGLGVMGAATLRELAGRGFRVLGLDAHPPGHVLGSSHGRSRIIREAYYEAPAYVPLVQAAFQGWRDLELEAATPLLELTGCLNIGRRGRNVVDGVIASAVSHGLQYEVLDATAMRQRFPAFHLSDDECGVFQPRAGVLNADACVHAMLATAVNRGATVRHTTAMTKWTIANRGPAGDAGHRRGSGVVIETHDERIATDRLIVTAGPWAPTVLADAGLPLQAVRQYVVHFDPDDQTRFTPDVFPTFIWDVPEGEVYGIPYLEGSGVKVGGHDPGQPCTPDRANRVITAAEIETVRSLFQRYVPGSAMAVRDALSCLYTMTPDRHFIVDVHPRHPEVIIAAGFSGHGFKFGPTIGRILADLAIDGRTPYDIDFLRATRFGS